MNNDRSAPGVHDLGGRLDEDFAESEHDYAPWEKRVHAIREVLARKDLLAVDELRRQVESQDESDYIGRSYYEQWIWAISEILIDKAVIERTELDDRLRTLRVVHG